MAYQLHGVFTVAAQTVNGGASTNKFFTVLGTDTNSSSSGVTGGLRIYSPGSTYWDISGDKTLSSSITLTLPTSGGTLVSATSGSTTGNTVTPVYINSNGVAIACSGTSFTIFDGTDDSSVSTTMGYNGNTFWIYICSFLRRIRFVFVKVLMSEVNTYMPQLPFYSHSSNEDYYPATFYSTAGKYYPGYICLGIEDGSLIASAYAFTAVGTRTSVLNSSSYYIVDTTIEWSST